MLRLDAGKVPGTMSNLFHSLPQKQQILCVFQSYCACPAALTTSSVWVPHPTGAIGKDAMAEKGKLNANTNLQYGVTIAAGDDVFLSATDGVWDTIDPVQAGTPAQLKLPYPTWEQVPPAKALEIAHVVSPTCLPPQQNPWDQ